MKRLTAITALLFASGLMTTGGVLACLYSMPSCHQTPACHHEATKITSASCCTGMTTGRTVSAPNARFTLAISQSPAVDFQVDESFAGVEIPAASVPSHSPPVLNLRV